MAQGCQLRFNFCARRVLGLLGPQSQMTNYVVYGYDPWHICYHIVKKNQKKLVYRKF